MRDMISGLDFKRAISPAAAVADNTAFVSQIVDTQGCEGVMLAILLGALADADATFTVLIEDGDAANLSDAAAVADDELNGLESVAGFTFAADDKIRKIGYRGGKRYVRATITPANNTGNVYLAAVWILNRNQRPAPVTPA